MKKYIKKEIITTVVELVQCDKCNAVEKYHDFDGSDVASFKYQFGYLSKEGRDQSTIEFDLCDECLIDLLDKANIRYRITRGDINVTTTAE